MIMVGAFDAKTHFSQLLADVSHGEEVVITRHGKKIARLLPVLKRKSPAVEAIERVRALRKGIRLGKNVTLRQLIDEGRA